MHASRHLLHSAALMLTVAAVADAAPLDLSRVPAGGQWVMHLDMDAARESTVMGRAWDRAVKLHPHAEQMMRMWTGLMGMDPRTDLHDATAYGLDTDKHNAVLVVRAKANRAMLEKMVAKAPDHQTMTHGSHTLHAWTHKGWKGRMGHPVAGAFHRDDVLVFARSPDRVKAALDVLDGERPAVAGDGPLGGRVRPGSILVARAAAVDADTTCPVLRQARGFRVALGEHDGTSFYRARLDMKSDEDADRAEDVVEGLEALARLRWADNPNVMRLVDGLEARSEGRTCTVSWDAAADDVWTVADAMADRWEQKRKEWTRMRGGDGCACGKDGCKGCDECPGGCPLSREDRGGRSDGPLRDDEF